MKIIAIPDGKVLVSGIDCDGDSREFWFDWFSQAVAMVWECWCPENDYIDKRWRHAEIWGMTNDKWECVAFT